MVDGKSVKLSWSELTSSDFKTEVKTEATGAAVSNEITGNAVLDSISNFFRRLFGLEARGIKVSQQGLSSEFKLEYHIQRKAEGEEYRD